MAFSELNHIEDAYFDPNFDSYLEEKVYLLAPTKHELKVEFCFSQQYQ